MADADDAGGRTLLETVRGHAAARPGADAFVEPDARMTWRDYDERSRALALALEQLGVARGDRVGVLLPDGAAVHAAFLACERAGAVVVGIGPRAGDREVAHLLGVTGATVLVTAASHRGRDGAELVGRVRSLGAAVEHHLVLDDVPAAAPPGIEPAGPPAGPDELFLLNSTSGTTGLPKCVMHTQARWRYFHGLAVEAAALDAGDVFLSAIPAPFGFGLWTAHVTPALLGCPTVVLPQFRADTVLELIERERVSVLACVSTQFMMLLDSPAFEQHDLSSLRCMFTGGEAVPYARAAAFEERTGAAVLQFYGSNETGALSRTTLADTRDRRLRTAGRVIDGMAVRLFDDAGADVTAAGRGQAGCRGPAMSTGYYNDPEANGRLFTPDGWMLTGDIVEIDAGGYLSVVGRVADFIIRGGKNISAVQVEEEVATHPAVAVAAAVGMPDDVFGERVCVFAELRPGAAPLTLEDLTGHLLERGVGKELLPERLVVTGELPRSSGGKIAKGALRDRARELAGAPGA